MRLTQQDYAIANRIIHHRDIYPMITDDYADPNHTQLGTFFLTQPTIWLVHPSEHVLLMTVPRTMVVHEVHTMIEPEGRGKQAVKDVQAAAKWYFENEGRCEKIITYVPFHNKPAYSFAKIVGMKDEGVCTKSFKKNGVLLDQWVLGLEKEAFLCRQS